MSAGPPLPSQCEWLKIARETVLDDEPYMRADARRNRLAIVRILGWRADPETRLTRPTIAGLMEMTGLSRRAIQYHLRAIERLGLVELTEPGTTPQFRPAIRHGEGNLAREYRLVNPLARTTCTPPSVTDLDLKTSRARARADNPGPASRLWPLSAVTPGWWDHLTNTFAGAGWTEADIRHAVDYDYTGRQHRHRLDTIEHPTGWLRYRLGQWQDDHGTPLRSPSQLRTAEHEQLRAGQAEARQARQEAAQRAAGVDVAGQAARARAMLASRPCPGMQDPGAVDRFCNASGGYERRRDR